MKQKKGISKWVYYFTLGVAIIFVYKFVSDFGALVTFIQRIVSVTMPFIMGIIIAYLFYRPVTFIERKMNKNKVLEKVSRPVSVFALYILAVVLVVLLIKQNIYFLLTITNINIIFKVLLLKDFFIF